MNVIKAILNDELNLNDPIYDKIKLFRKATITFTISDRDFTSLLNSNKFNFNELSNEAFTQLIKESYDANGTFNLNVFVSKIITFKYLFNDFKTLTGSESQIAKINFTGYNEPFSFGLFLPKENDTKFKFIATFPYYGGKADNNGSISNVNDSSSANKNIFNMFESDLNHHGLTIKLNESTVVDQLVPIGMNTNNNVVKVNGKNVTRPGGATLKDYLFFKKYKAYNTNNLYETLTQQNSVDVFTENYKNFNPEVNALISYAFSEVSLIDFIKENDFAIMVDGKKVIDKELIATDYAKSLQKYYIEWKNNFVKSAPKKVNACVKLPNFDDVCKEQFKYIMRTSVYLTPSTYQKLERQLGIEPEINPRNGYSVAYHIIRSMLDFKRDSNLIIDEYDSNQFDSIKFDDQFNSSWTTSSYDYKVRCVSKSKNLYYDMIYSKGMYYMIFKYSKSLDPNHSIKDVIELLESQSEDTFKNNIGDIIFYVNGKYFNKYEINFNYPKDYGKVLNQLGLIKV